MKEHLPQLLLADRNGRIYNAPYLQATGMKGDCVFRLTRRDLIALPQGSELFRLPGRIPIGYNPMTREFATTGGYAVAAFVSPGVTVTFNSAYTEGQRPHPLPLFSYAAVARYKGSLYAAAVTVDRERRQDLRFMNMQRVRKNAAKLKRLFSGNRLFKHLKRCALEYSCPAAKNFFLSRYEAPLPASPACNARCVGCISHQPTKRRCATQPRITFVPTPQEIAEIALFHIARTKDPVVSFGQGCEGEPLLVGTTLERAITLIRNKTTKGVINCNTNASKPRTIARLFDAGLDSIRVSINSAREHYYSRYYKPRSYRFPDVTTSIRAAKRRGGFVSLNYLTMPGFTDSRDECTAFTKFVENCRIDMVQWRNLNFDPLAYMRILRYTVDIHKLIGVRKAIARLKRHYPHLMMGYFNPSRRRIKRRGT
jgi:pyruvate-formate lyase-activating enzyme